MLPYTETGRAYREVSFLFPMSLEDLNLNIPKIENTSWNAYALTPWSFSHMKEPYWLLHFLLDA